MKQILSLHREICNTLNLKPNRLPEFYPKLKAKLASSWKAQALFKKFDARANHKVYGKGKICPETRVMIIGAGPCGLRAAIECQLLGAKVVVIEKRDRLSRNNVLHLWPFVIHDLMALGAKKFFGKFCAGSINHISIRQLQCILMKVSLLLGVEIFEGVAFEELLQPCVSKTQEILGWRARVSPDHPVSQYEFDVLIGADGKRNTLKGFKKHAFRGKLAIGITANFINRHTEREAAVPEISGVAYIFYQKFFNELNAATGIDLENIVYYKDDTHYFVMTAKKQSLIKKGVLRYDYPEVSRLISKENMDRDALMQYAREAAQYATNDRLPTLDFAVNQSGEPDVALFDFSTMYTSENASIVYERHGRRILCQLVGDSLLEPFWPTGSGCARGFLSALDAAWAVRSWGQNPPPHPLLVIAERESIYRLLPQTTTDNLQRDFGAYTLDPCTRYPNLNRTCVTPNKVTSYYQSDDPLPLDITTSPKKRRRDPEISQEAIIAWVGYAEPGIRKAASPQALYDLVKRYRPDLLTDETPDTDIYTLLHDNFGIPLLSNDLSELPESKIRAFLTRVFYAFKGEVPHIQHDSNLFNELIIQKKNSYRSSVPAYTYAAQKDKSHSPKRKRRSPGCKVSDVFVENISSLIDKLDLNEIRLLSHPSTSSEDLNTDKINKLQEEITALLKRRDSTEREMLTKLVADMGQRDINIRCTVNPKQNIAKFFGSEERVTVKPPSRKLKGLDPETIKLPRYEALCGDHVSKYEVEPMIDNAPCKLGQEKNKSFEEILHYQSIPNLSMTQSPTWERTISEPDLLALTSDSVRERREFFELQRNNDTIVRQDIVLENRSNSIENLRKSIADLIDGKQPYIPKQIVSIARDTEFESLKKEFLKFLFEKAKCNETKTKRERRGPDEIARKKQKLADMVERNKAQPLSSPGRRKAAREITKQRYQKSLQLLLLEPRLELVSQIDLENDYGLQQYRASAPKFQERVQKFEAKLQHGEGKLINEPLKASSSGIRVARLAAELSNTPAIPTPKASKPKDLMRSVGKISHQDWNVKLIERKITENRLGRPGPSAAERVPKWDREQFLGRQRRLQEGDSNDEKWDEIDTTIQKIDLKLSDTGRPQHGTKKVAKLAEKFVSGKPEPKQENKQKEDSKKVWRGQLATGKQCPVCEECVYAAESVSADGMQFHRACFRCAVCNNVLKPGEYTRERFGVRLVCLRHATAYDALLENVAKNDYTYETPQVTPERIFIELSEDGGLEIDEDEWTDRNFITSEASAAGDLSAESSPEDNAEDQDNAGDDDQSEPAERPPRAVPSSQFSDDSHGYDDYSDDGAESSNESLSNMREAREARRREVPTNAPPPYTSSEMETDDESDSSDDEKSSATEVSTDSEFAREESIAVPAPPAILVTEVPPTIVPPPQDYPLSRTKSAGGLATKRALELKRKYLLGEPSPPTVRKSESTSHIDSKLEAFRSNITEFQKMLNPATPLPQPVTTYLAHQIICEEKKPEKPIPDIIKNLADQVSVDLLTKGDPAVISKVQEPIKDETEPDLETDSLSDSSNSEVLQNQSVPRVEVHDEGGELIQLDSLILVSNEIEEAEEKVSRTATSSGPTVVAVESESSESCKDATTLALTETELSDWAAESVVLDECGIDENSELNRNKNPRSLSGPKLVHDAKNIESIATHICGRGSPELVVYSNAPEHFEFADEGDPDPVLEAAVTSNDGYMELVDDDYEPYSTSRDRSMNFIERVYSDTTVKSDPNDTLEKITSNLSETLEFIDSPDSKSESMLNDTEIVSKPTTASNSSDMKNEKNEEGASLSVTSNSSSYNPISIEDSVSINEAVNKAKVQMQSISLTAPPRSVFDRTDVSKINSVSRKNFLQDFSPPVIIETNGNASSLMIHPLSGPRSHNLRTYSPAICRSASETFTVNSRKANPPACDNNWSISGSTPTVQNHASTQVNRVEELKRERENQIEVVKRLVLERLGGAKVCRKSTRRSRVSPSSLMPPPVPPPPILATPPSPLLRAPLQPTPFPAAPKGSSSLPRTALSVQSSFSDPELTRQHRPKSFMKSISNYFNKRLGPRHKCVSEPDLTTHNNQDYASRRTLEGPPVPPPPVEESVREPKAPPVPPPPLDVPGPPVPPPPITNTSQRLSQAKAPPVPPPPASYDPPSRIARQEAETVAEILELSARHNAHEAMKTAVRNEYKCEKCGRDSRTCHEH
ncbi:unnamed protein product [Leptosia nina]|uniref:F-actin monooxygenase n=1 Tax=Leptosia nina TaxID=320188 RepID=A0AAV1JWP8_9NEOP